MKIVKFCLLPMLALLVLLFLLGMAAREGWDVEVSTRISAGPEEIYPFVDDLRRWPEWTVDAREGSEPLEFHFSGPPRGVGARALSQGPHSSVRWEITASDPAKGVWFDEWLEGDIQAKGAIMFTPVEGGTRVTWVDRGSLGDMPFIKLFHYLMQASLTESFQRNLETLKRLVEGS